MDKTAQLAEMGQRIRARRESLGISQEALALAAGYKSRSSINKIELGKNDIGQRKIKAIADALSVTPGYIMGWVDEEKPATKNDDGRTKEFADLFTQLTEAERNLVIAQIKGILSSR